MKPTRRMASIRTGCWCRGTAFPMSRKPFRLRSQSHPERIAKFPAGSSISTAYITASFWLTPLSVYGALYRKHAGGAVSGAAIGISEGREHCPLGADHDDRQASM